MEQRTKTSKTLLLKMRTKKKTTKENLIYKKENKTHTKMAEII